MPVIHIIPSSPNLLIDRYGLQSAAPANIAMINHLQDSIANASPYSLVGFVLNHPSGLTPTLSMIGSAECPPGSGCYCSSKEVLCFTISNFATGKYMITLSIAPANGFNVLIAPLVDARQNIGVEIINPTQVIVSIYDIPSGAYVDNAFKNTYIQFMLWN